MLIGGNILGQLGLLLEQTMLEQLKNDERFLGLNVSQSDDEDEEKKSIVSTCRIGLYGHIVHDIWATGLVWSVERNCLGELCCSVDN